MKLTVLTDNYAGTGFLAEHGLSYLVESNGHKVLLDTGSTDVFLQNASKLGIDIHKEINTTVLSHGHWDHGNGLQHFSTESGKTLITHPLSFQKRYRKRDKSNIGLNLSKKEISEMFTLKVSKKPYSISDNIIFLGEIPRANNFESQTTPFIDINEQPDFVVDDSALAIIENSQLLIVTGCSHSGICNIISYAMEVTGISEVRAVIGGLHLKHNNHQTQETIKFFKSHNISKVYPSHCTEAEAIHAFEKELPVGAVKTGMKLEL